MFVQSVDGRFYRNPRLVTPKLILEISDDGIYVKRKGVVEWSTARRDLPSAGIHCRFIEAYVATEKVIIGEELVAASVFKVELRKPIPTPTTYEGYSTTEPKGVDEEIWKQNSGRR